MLSGHKWRSISDEDQEVQNRFFKGYTGGMIISEPDSWFYMKSFLPMMNSYYTFKFRPSDIVVLTYAKCGTTWTQEIIWTMKNNPNLDHPMAGLSVNERCPFLEFDPLIESPAIPAEYVKKELVPILQKLDPSKNPDDGIFLQIAAASPDPRIIKTHLPFSLLTPNMLDTSKVVYVARNPKDVCTSFYHHSRIIKVHAYVGDLDTFVDLFVKDKIIFSPYGKHLKEAWKLRGHPNLLFLFYEDMIADTEKTVRQLDEFIGAKLTDQQIKNVLHQSSFATMKSNATALPGEDIFMSQDIVAAEGGFFRKGKAGSYKESLTPEQEKKIEDWAQREFPEIPFKY